MGLDAHGTTALGEEAGGLFCQLALVSDGGWVKRSMSLERVEVKHVWRKTNYAVVTSWDFSGAGRTAVALEVTSAGAYFRERSEVGVLTGGVVVAK